MTNLVENNIIRKFMEIGCRIATIINPLIFKKVKYVVFYESAPAYMNNYVLMKYMVSMGLDKKYKIFYFPDIREEANLDEETYKNVSFSNSISLAFILFLVSKYVFLDTGNLRMKPTKKQCVVYMDHGLPFKLDGLLRKKYNKKTSVPKDLIMPVNYFISTSPEFDQMNRDSFNLSQNQLLRCGRPRTDALYSRKNYLNVIGIEKEQYNKVIMWMTTWRVAKNGRAVDTTNETFRSTSLPLLTDMDIISRFNEYLRKKNYLLLIKIHQGAVFDENSINDLSNVKLLLDKDIVSKNIQIYDILKDCDLLITDYSSAFLDYSITLKPMIFITDDIKEFTELHGFYFDDPLGFMPGPKANSYDELIDLLNNIEQNKIEYSKMREKLKNYCHYYQDGRDSARLLELLGIR